MGPTERDLRALHAWWDRIGPTIPPEVAGLWFGITELIHDGPVRTLYLAGCPTFDAADPSGDWASSYSWWPNDRYIELADFAALPNDPIEAVLDIATSLVRSLDFSELVGLHDVAVGFDDGDLRVL